MTWYKIKADVRKKLSKRKIIEITQFSVDLLNLNDFRFRPSEQYPNIQEFIDKYPDLIEPADEP